MDTFVRGGGQFVSRLLREAGHHPEIADLLFTVIHTRRQAYRRVLALAIARGELAASGGHELLIDLLIGLIWTRLLIIHDPITGEYVDSVVETVLTAFDVKPSTRSMTAGLVDVDGPGEASAPGTALVGVTGQ